MKRWTFISAKEMNYEIDVSISSSFLQIVDARLEEFMSGGTALSTKWKCDS